MNVFPKNPQSPYRDRLIFSKAHDAKALYAVLALRGFFKKTMLEVYEVNGGSLPGHATRHCAPGVEVSAGSLGHGLSMASGIAYAGKLDKKKFRVFTILSDGECNEGSTWEAILFAGHHKLDNLMVTVDYNKLQGVGFTKDVLDLEPFRKKWQSFQWEVREINGHNLKEIIHALHKLPFQEGKPSVIIAHTIKGLGGVASHVNQVSSQYKPPTEEELESVLKSLA
jgi:transketolase